MLLDLGGGHGGVLVGAARAGARAIGFDVQPSCLNASRAAAARAGVSARVEVLNFDFLKSHQALVAHSAFQRASVVFAYLTRKLIGELAVPLRAAVAMDKFLKR